MKKLMTLAAGVVGMAAMVIGMGSIRGEDGFTHGCLPPPPPAETFKVHFARTLGIGDFRGFPALDVDASKLSPEEAKELRKLIEDASFFELKSSPALPPDIPDPVAGYDLTVEMDGRTHTIWAMDGDISKSLQPLIDSLTLRATANDILEQFVVPAKAAEEQPVHVEFNKSGGIAGFSWTATVDTSKLSAEDAGKLAGLITDALFFDLPEQFPPSGVADGFGYTITVEKGGKRHTVNVDEEAVPTSLKPLVEWLSGRATLDGPIGCEVPA